jgi:ABC-2 type transport system ATP-binding protein
MRAIEVNNLSKSYNEIRAVTDFSFYAEGGEILALAGPDGAGKTSIFRSICSLIEFDAGEVRIHGYDLHEHHKSIKQLMGYMPQSFSLYPDLSVAENLHFYAGLFGIKGERLAAKREQLYRFSGLGPFARRRAGHLSGGMKQKLALSCCLIHDPAVLLLDEPTTGVDPLSRRQFWDILKTLKEHGSAVVVSTPYMDEVALADRAVFIFNGRKLAEGRPEELTQRFRGSVYRADISVASHDLDDLSRIKGLRLRRFGSSVHIYTDEGHRIEQFHEALSGVGIKPEMIRPDAPGLEDAFVQLMEN